MKFNISDDVKELGIKIILLKAYNVDNLKVNNIFLEFKSNKVNDIVKKYEDFNFKEDNITEGYYDIHSKVNVPRRKNLPSEENLIKLVLKRNELVSINKVVDLYNIVSCENRICIAAFDTDTIKGNINLRLTDGTENYLPLGSDEVKEVPKGIYSFMDDENDIITYLDMRQVDKTKVTDDTKNVYYIVIGNENTSKEYLDKTVDKIIDYTSKYCGGIFKEREYYGKF